MDLFMVECGPLWLTSEETWWLVTEQKTPDEARRFAERYCRVKFPSLTVVTDDSRVKKLSDCPLYVNYYQRLAWDQEGTHRHENARIVILRD